MKPIPCFKNYDSSVGGRKINTVFDIINNGTKEKISILKGSVVYKVKRDKLYVCETERTVEEKLRVRWRGEVTRTTNTL